MPGCQLWLSRFNDPINAIDNASAMAVSPDGRTVYVTGRSHTASGTKHTFDYGYATVAYDAATGAQLWLSRYDRFDGNPVAVAVSQGSRTVFVTGDGNVSGTHYDYVTIAYSAATGAELWVSRYRAPAYRSNDAVGLAVGPGGRDAYVTGTGWRAKGGLRDYLTIALRAATGARRWVARYNGPAGREDSPVAIVVSPAGRRVYVTGTSRGAGTYFDYATIAYRA